MDSLENLALAIKLDELHPDSGSATRMHSIKHTYPDTSNW